MLTFIHSGSEIRIYRLSSGNKLEGRASYMTSELFNKKCLKKSFDGDAENILLSILMYLQIASTYIYNGYPKLKSILGFWSHRQTIF